MSHPINYLKRHLSCEYQFVTFKQPSGGVNEDRIRDTIRKILASLCNVIRFDRSFNCNMEYHVEGFQRKLINWIDFKQIIENEIKNRCPGSHWSVKLSSLINFNACCLCLSNLTLNISCCLLCVFQIFNQLHIVNDIISCVG